MCLWLVIAVALVSVLPPSVAYAAEVMVEGVLKAVDAKERTLTLEKKTAKGTKKLSLEVAEEAGDLASLKVGDEVSVNYDSTLEVVTKILRPEAESTEVEVVVLKELGMAGHPWVTKDGLTIYFTAKESPQGPSFVWVATRANTGTLFKDKKQVSLGLDNTFSKDGLEGIIFLPEEGKGTLQSIKRNSVTEDFSRPTLVKEFGWKELGGNTWVVSPGLSDDRLTLYYEIVGKGPCFSTRSTLTAPWSKPKQLPIVIGEDGGLRFPYVSDDGLWLFCTDTGVKDPTANNISLYGRAKNSDPFAFKGRVRAGNTPVSGEFPRYAPKTKELFFVKKTEGRPEINVVKNFDPLKVAEQQRMGLYIGKWKDDKDGIIRAIDENHRFIEYLANGAVHCTGHWQYLVEGEGVEVITDHGFTIRLTPLNATQLKQKTQKTSEVEATKWNEPGRTLTRAAP